MEQQNNGVGIAALILGILSVVWVLLPGGAVVSLILGIVAVILAARSRRSCGPNGLATGGTIFGIIGIIIFVVIVILFVVAGVAILGGLAMSLGS